MKAPIGLFLCFIGLVSSAPREFDIKPSEGTSTEENAILKNNFHTQDILNDENGSHQTTDFEEDDGLNEENPNLESNWERVRGDFLKMMRDMGDALYEDEQSMEESLATRTGLQRTEGTMNQPRENFAALVRNLGSIVEELMEPDTASQDSVVEDLTSKARPARDLLYELDRSGASQSRNPVLNFFRSLSRDLESSNTRHEPAQSRNDRANVEDLTSRARPVRAFVARNGPFESGNPVFNFFRSLSRGLESSNTRDEPDQSRNNRANGMSDNAEGDGFNAV